MFFLNSRKINEILRRLLITYNNYQMRISYKGRTVDALAPKDEEGRDYLRKAAASWT